MTDRRIVIIGFMGCGKTTVARALAERLGSEALDLDSFIAEHEGRSASEIIEKDGEAAFREIETLSLSAVLQQTDAQVIALGGGAWTVPANRTVVALHDCLSVWLDAPFDLCWQRISEGVNAIRPLAPDRESALALYESRRSDYQLAEVHVIAGESDTAEDLVIRIPGHD